MGVKISAECSERHLGPRKTTMVELFCENISQILGVNYICKNAFKMFERFRNMSLIFPQNYCY